MTERQVEAVALAVALRYAEQIARVQSADGCVQHVNAVIRGGRIVGYVVSDWYDGSTVCSWANGQMISGCN